MILIAVKEARHTRLDDTRYGDSLKNVDTIIRGNFKKDTHMGISDHAARGARFYLFHTSIAYMLYIVASGRPTQPAERYPSDIFKKIVHGSWLKRAQRFEYFLNAPSKPPVELSWPLPVPGSLISLRIFFARTLPSSTPHWSKLLMSQTAPSVKVRCS